MEIWKDIKDFEGYYQVSNLGNVRSLTRTEKFQRKDSLKVSTRTRQGRDLIPKIDRYGYSVVHLRKDGVINVYRAVHRLVAETFIDNPENKPTVNHKDCNKQNNVLTNLEWNTISENTKHASDNGLLKPTVVSMKGENNVAFKLFPDVCMKIKQLKSEKLSVSEIAKAVGLHYATVSRYLKSVK